MRKLLTVGVLLAALAACEPSKPPVARDEWIPIANTTDGGQVLYRQDAIVRDANAGVSDITLKVTYPALETWIIDLPGYVEQKHLNAERVTLRFDCAAKRFAVVKREALDAGGDVKETVTPVVGGKETFLPIAPGGLAQLAVSRACP